MVKDPAELAEIKKGWAGVLRLRDIVKAYAGASALSGGAAALRLANIAHNLPFIQAFAVLHDTLRQLRDDGVFSCERNELGMLLKESESVLPWKDFSKVKKGKDLRNDVAHEAKILDRAEAWEYTDAVEAELKNLRII